VADEFAIRRSLTVASGGVAIAPTGRSGKRDVLIAATLFVGFLVLFTSTRSRWLDDYDSVGFALALTNFDVEKHQPHPPGYPIYVLIGKLLYLIVGDQASALTLLSSLAGAAVATLFYVLSRRHLPWSMALCAATIMALTPVFLLQASLALSDMFAMVFVLLFLLVEGLSPRTHQDDNLRRIAAGVIAGLSLGARPHVTLLIVAYWCIESLRSRSLSWTHILTAVVAFSAGTAAWLIPTALATGGLETYLSACLRQFEWRFGKPGISVLGAPISGYYWIHRARLFIGSLGQALFPVQPTQSTFLLRTVLGLGVLVPYSFCAWHGPSRAIARPYLIASAVYLLMLFIMLPPQMRYFLPLCPVVGWSVPGFLSLLRSYFVQGAVAIGLLALHTIPSFLLLRGLSKVPPPVAMVEWVKSSYPIAILFYSRELGRHTTFYWPGGDTRPMPNDPDECKGFLKEVSSTRPVFLTSQETSMSRKLCGIDGIKIRTFNRDPKIQDRYPVISVFRFGTVKAKH
jgi:hypothetical protein